jgi:septum formation protein
MVRLILASASPRRAELLRAAGYAFEIEPADVDESAGPAEPAEDYVLRVAGEKAQAVLRRCPDCTVLAADTTVVVDGIMLGKPADDEHARQMLARLSGRAHRVLTGVALAGGGREVRALASTLVRFAVLTPEEIDWYVASGEPRDKAGAYGVQGLASRFVEGIEGSYTNVVGLPVALVHALLAQSGHSWRRDPGDDGGDGAGTIDRARRQGVS